MTFAYQWLANDGQNDAEMEDATGATHEVGPADVGKTLKVRVTFTDGGGTEEVLTSAATETVEALSVEVSIAAAATPVTEGSDAVFTLTRTGDASAALTVGVSVSVSGAFPDGTAPTEAGFAAGASTATLRVATANDGTAEADGRVSASVASGAGYVVVGGVRQCGRGRVRQRRGRAGGDGAVVGGHDGGGLRKRSHRGGERGPADEHRREARTSGRGRCGIGRRGGSFISSSPRRSPRGTV